MKIFAILIVPFIVYSHAFATSDTSEKINPWRTADHTGYPFQTDQAKRRLFEKDHAIDHLVIKENTDCLSVDPKQILLLPFNIRHLRQTLQFLFFIATEYVLASQENPDLERSLDFVFRTLNDINMIHPQAFNAPSAKSEWHYGKIYHDELPLGSFGSNLEENKQRIAVHARKKGLNLEGLYSQLYEKMTQYQLLKFVREFKPDDTLGFNKARNTIGILDDGEHYPSSESWVNSDFPEAYGQGRGIHGSPGTNYLPSMDLNSRIVIDFNRIDPFIAVPIDASMNDWQKDWPDSAGIRFFIANKTYDIYFPTKWSNYHMDLAPKRLGLSEHSQGFHGHIMVDGSEIVETPDGIIYQPVLNDSNIERSYKSINYGYYPFQTPRIIKAFKTRPLHRIWSIARSFGRGGSDQIRAAADQKDECKEYKSFEEALRRYDIMPRFEFLWDNRSSFYPEHHITELRYYISGYKNRTIDDFYKHADHSFSFNVPFAPILKPYDFLQELEKVDKVNSAFTWDRSDYENEILEKEKTATKIKSVNPTPQQIEQEAKEIKSRQTRKSKDTNQFKSFRFGFFCLAGVVSIGLLANSILDDESDPESY